MRDKIIKFQAFLASPIHIGSGEYYEPFSYVIKNNKIYHFDTSVFLSKLPSEKIKQFTMIVKNPSFSKTLEARKFIYENFDISSMANIVFDEQDVSSSDFANEYSEKLINLASKDFNNKMINMLEIEKTYSSGGYTVIPGSSIKGSIRTAIVNKIIEDNHIKYDPTRRDEYKKLMKEMNLSFTDDIFKILKVSDFSKSESVGKWIGYFHNYPKKSLEKSVSGELTVASEVIRPFQLFAGWLTIGDIPTHKYKRDVDNILESKQNLFKCLNRHYLELFKKDYNLFKEKSLNHNFVKIVDKQGLIDKLNENKYAVIRVGKHSGAEGVTFKERAIKIKENKRRQAVHDAKEPTTVWYFSQKKINNINSLYPMGWLILI
ncbi:MAG: CRISPR-associated protein Csm5 [Deferribacteres bacterium]|jgi:CRISPR-associated protein Csm5|nr:CRISPR-associated protein Csm5 family [Deferribacteraceae bacterium]MDK2792952.1 CRISPR-associated protein Csm5 [Deferribacteres bacterium]